jgi:hypothetical protein
MSRFFDRKRWCWLLGHDWRYFFPIDHLDPPYRICQVCLAMEAVV